MFGIVPQILLIGIRLYQITARALGAPSPCRFYPSCSTYAEQAIQNFGAIHGMRMTVGRLLRCHPWNTGGVDLPGISRTNK